MRKQKSIGLRIGSVCAMLLLVAATAMPAFWKMTCYSSDRVVAMWGQAEDCMPVLPSSDNATIKLLCCDFTSVQSDISAFERHGTVHFVPALNQMADFTEVRALGPLHDRSGRIEEHGPPLRVAKPDLLAIGRLRI
ncbi:MAG: hypothetical protein ABI432_15185 [Flavobacteriales bacterium]